VSKPSTARCGSAARDSERNTCAPSGVQTCTTRSSFSGSAAVSAALLVSVALERSDIAICCMW
jgi:hypothetical protein